MQGEGRTFFHKILSTAFTHLWLEAGRGLELLAGRKKRCYSRVGREKLGRPRQAASPKLGCYPSCYRAVRRPVPTLRQTLHFLACPGPEWTPDSLAKVKGARF